MSSAAIEEAFRNDSGKAIATLIRLFGDVDVAEEAVQEAFVEATRRWSSDGVPPSTAGWIITTAKRKAIDRLRREGSRSQKQEEAMAMVEPPTGDFDVETLRDDQLRLIFTCCHPALSMPARVGLTLRLLGGLQTPEIARALIVSESTMAQRLVRAKGKIKAARIPYRVPDDVDLPDRLPSVLAVVYLIYNEGHTRTSGAQLGRTDLRMDAIRLARLVVELMPDEPEALGLLALLLLTESRQPARIDGDGGVVLLADQDRSRWDRALIEEGHLLVRACLRRNRPGQYQIQAAIAAVHADATTAPDTDWHQIVALYDQLLALAPNPMVALNRAVAIAERDGPEPALRLLEDVALEDHHLFHAARGEMLSRVGRHAEAADEFERAGRLTDNETERGFLTARASTERDRPDTGPAG